MCVAIPGRLVAVWGDNELRLGRVLLEGRVLEVNLTMLPEARPGDYIIVHSGIGVSIVDDAEAQRAIDVHNGRDR